MVRATSVVLGALVVSEADLCLHRDRDVDGGVSAVAARRRRVPLRVGRKVPTVAVERVGRVDLAQVARSNLLVEVVRVGNEIAPRVDGGAPAVPRGDVELRRGAVEAAEHEAGNEIVLHLRERADVVDRRHFVVAVDRGRRVRELETRDPPDEARAEAQTIDDLGADPRASGSR